MNIDLNMLEQLGKEHSAAIKISIYQHGIFVTLVDNKTDKCRDYDLVLQGKDLSEIAESPVTMKEVIEDMITDFYMYMKYGD